MATGTVGKGSACGWYAPVLIVGSCDGDGVGGEVGPKLGGEGVGFEFTRELASNGTYFSFVVSGSKSTM